MAFWLLEVFGMTELIEIHWSENKHVVFLAFTYSLKVACLLFYRLVRMGHSAVMLRTQYRCHPRISAVPNDLFYSGRLRDGVTAADRPALVPGVPPLVFVDVPRGSEQQRAGGSFYNEAEAGVLRAVIRGLLEAGVEAGEIGVITLYKAQMHCLTDKLAGNR